MPRYIPAALEPPTTVEFRIVNCGNSPDVPLQNPLEFASVAQQTESVIVIE
jgi:hypothetical protein